MLVEWSSEARDDLTQHVDFLRQRSSTAALRALSVIFAAADQLVEFPESGRVYRRDPMRRELLVSFGASGYSLLYEVEANQVRILGIKHHREAGY